LPHRNVIGIGGAMTGWRRLTSPEDGQDLLEYGLLASLIALVAIAAVGLIGEHMNTFFWNAIAINI
jgi:Flp pilus assembly pilin Flp